MHIYMCISIMIALIHHMCMLLHMALTKRVQVLMEPAEFTRLEAIAASQGLGLGELLRRAARSQYAQGAETRLEAARAISALDLPAIDDLSATLVSARQPDTP
jgi:hypothetical protein